MARTDRSEKPSMQESPRPPSQAEMYRGQLLRRAPLGPVWSGLVVGLIRIVTRVWAAQVWSRSDGQEGDGSGRRRGSPASLLGLSA